MQQVHTIEGAVQTGPAVFPPGRTAPSWEDVERQDWRLWKTAIIFIFVLGLSLLTFMFPMVFWFAEDLGIRAPQRAFFGFCILLGLMSIYLMQRQSVIRRLKQQVFAARMEARESERRANIELFLSLPGVAQFRDGLAMEYRRASSSASSLAVALFSAGNCEPDDMGRLATIVRSALRRGETLARLEGRRIGVILPGMALADAISLAGNIEQRIAIELPGTEVLSTVTAYPQQSGSLLELEAPLRGLG